MEKPARAATVFSKYVLGIYLFHMALVLFVKQYMTAQIHPTALVVLVCLLIDLLCIVLCFGLRKLPVVRELVTI